MANVKQLEAQIVELRQLLAAQGIRVDSGEQPEQAGPRPDYIGFGSPQHAALLGLVEVADNEDTTDYATYTSPSSEKVYRLADEYEPARTFPAMDPEKSVRIILKQKVGSLESGQPPIPDNAPSMWKPRDMP